MKKYLLIAALMCGSSFVSMASKLPAVKRSISNTESRSLFETILLSPKDLETGSFRANGMQFMFVYDPDVAGDYEAALGAAIAYAAWYRNC